MRSVAEDPEQVRGTPMEDEAVTPPDRPSRQPILW